MASRIRVRVDRAADALEQLRECKLVERLPSGQPEAHYRFAPQTPDLVRAIDGLAAVFDDQRATVLRVINSQAIERVRMDAMRVFAHAFVIKKWDDDA